MILFYMTYGNFTLFRDESDENSEEVEIIPSIIRTTTTNKVFYTKRISGSNEKG